MKKTVVSLLLALCMVCTLLPVTASAATSYNIWVGGTQVTDTNAADVLGDGTVSYDSTTNTLTLNGATITGNQKFDGGATDITRVGDGPDRTGILSDGSLTIELAAGSQNTITGTTGYSSYGIYVAGDLTITGTGSLKVSAADVVSNYSACSIAVYATSKVTVKRGCTVEASHGSASSIDSVFYNAEVEAGTKISHKGSADASWISDGCKVNSTTFEWTDYHTPLDDSDYTFMKVEPCSLVKITCGTGMSYYSGGSLTQAFEKGGSMADVIIKAQGGYYFPDNYVTANSGEGQAFHGLGSIKVEGSSDQITVRGSTSDVVTLTLPAATVKTQAAKPSASFEATGYDTGTLSGLDSNMKYSTDDTTWKNVTGSAGLAALTGLGPCTIQVVRKAGETTTESAPQNITVTRHSAPTTAAAIACTNEDDTDGKITGVSNFMQYRKSTDTGWTDITGNVIENLSAGEYQVRMKASGQALASDPQTVTVNPHSFYDVGLRPSGPITLEGRTVGYTDIPEKIVYVGNSGTLDFQLKDLSAELSGANSSSFLLDGAAAWNPTEEDTLEPRSEYPLSVKPVSGLSAGAYTATVTVKLTVNNTVVDQETFTVSFTVTDGNSGGGNQGGDQGQDPDPTTPDRPTYYVPTVPVVSTAAGNSDTTTGDAGQMGLWVTLLLASAAALTVAALRARKRSSAE